MEPAAAKLRGELAARCTRARERPAHVRLAARRSDQPEAGPEHCHQRPDLDQGQQVERLGGEPHARGRAPGRHRGLKRHHD
eukprot:scaffold62368_cov51-Phaeocystis_antarctica.AAC.1